MVASVTKGNIDAMNNLGYLLYYGHGTDRAPQDAVQLWRVAAFAGQSEAQWHLATAYDTGVGVEGDPAKAYAWYRCSIETASTKLRSDKGDTEAQILKDAKQFICHKGACNCDLAAASRSHCDGEAQLADPQRIRTSRSSRRRREGISYPYSMNIPGRVSFLGRRIDRKRTGVTTRS